MIMATTSVSTGQMSSTLAFSENAMVHQTFESETLNVLVSEQVRLIFQWIVYVVFVGAISSFGIVTNIINIICFVKQGLQDPINVSLLGLGISDLGCLMTMLATSFGFNPALHRNLGLTIDSIEILYLPVGWPHVVFLGVSSCLTAFIALERCLCITMPLKVKRIITPRRAIIIIVSLYVILLTSVCPIYCTNWFVMKFNSERNRTVLTLKHTPGTVTADQVSSAISAVFIPFSAYFTNIFCTVVLVIKLRQKAKWRMKCTTPKNAGSISVKDQKVAKMVVMISTLFIFCFSPVCVSVYAVMFIPELNYEGQYKNTIYVMGGISTLLESTNSASNIFIYYRMSTRYRMLLRQLCWWGKDSKTLQ